MTDDTLTIRYIPLDTLVRWDRNPKRHSLPDLIASIQRHGFKMPPRYEPTLNGGAGGIVAGNGRADALSAMKAQGLPPPRGIVADNGAWLVPILFGVDADSVAAAEAFGVDDNNLTMAGFDAAEQARMWEAEAYTALLRDLADDGQLPVSVGDDVLEGLLAVFERDQGTPQDPADLWKGMPDFEQEDLESWKSIRVHFDNKDDYNAFARLIGQTLTDKTRSIWYPYKAREDLTQYTVEDES